MTPDEMRDALASVLAQSGEGYTIADLEAELADGRSQIWIGEQCVMVTTLPREPEGLCLHVWLAAGDMADMLKIEPGIAAWGRAMGCSYASIVGRKGWDRILKAAGFHRVGQELRKSL